MALRRSMGKCHQASLFRELCETPGEKPCKWIPERWSRKCKFRSCWSPRREESTEGTLGWGGAPGGGRLTGEVWGGRKGREEVVAEEREGKMRTEHFKLTQNSTVKDKSRGKIQLRSCEPHIFTTAKSWSSPPITLRETARLSGALASARMLPWLPKGPCLGGERWRMGGGIWHTIYRSTSFTTGMRLAHTTTCLCFPASTCIHLALQWTEGCSLRIRKKNH